MRIKSCVRYEKQDDAPPQLTFDHTTENSDDIIHFAFTYPYTYAMVQEDMKRIDELSTKTDMENPESIYCCRELATYSLDGRRIDLVTITSALGANRENNREPSLEGLFPIIKAKDKDKDKKKRTSMSMSISMSSKSVNLDEESLSENDRDREDNKEVEDIINLRPLIFPSKEIVFVSARVHPGEVKTVFIS
jgi:DNA-directed RNA polymerase beta subunit